jgi:hypothetical protein
MKKEKIIEMACILASAVLQNPINGQIADSYRSFDHVNIVRQEATALMGLANEMGINIED